MKDAPSLAGKVALVTGSSRGIGRAIAQRLASAGATVVVTARSVDKAVVAPGTLSETVALIEKAGGRAIPVAADLEDQAALAGLVGRAVEAAGTLDILVNNAGYAEYARVDEMSLAVFDRTLNQYFRAPFILAQAAIPVMKAKGAGWIVNIGSVTAQPVLRPFPDYQKRGGDTVYASMKAALNRFTQGLAAELLAHNIAVNMVGPSTAIRTPGADRYIPQEFPTERVEYLAETVLAMCHLPAAERTGLLTHSMHFPSAHKLTVRSLDGQSELPPAEIPAWSHPAINPTGE